MIFAKDEKFTPPTPPVGVIESLTQGFETVAGHLLLLLLPLLLDIFLWTGPRISYTQALENVLALYESEQAIGFDQEIGGMAEDMWRDVVDGLSDLINAQTQQYLPFTPFVLLPMIPNPDIPAISLVGIPSLMAGREAFPLPFSFVPPVIDIQTPLGMIGVGLISKFAALLLGSLYLTMIANRVRGVDDDLSEPMRRYIPVTGQLFIVGLLVPLLLWFILIPFVLLGSGVAVAVDFTIGSAIIQIGFVLVLWAGMFVVFSIHDILLNGRNLFGALWDSVRIVQWNVTPTLLIVLIILVVNWGFSQVWVLADFGSWLALLAIVGHAFISTGLVAATFVFFKDRHRYWKEMRDLLLEELERRRAAEEEQSEDQSQVQES